MKTDYSTRQTASPNPNSSKQALTEGDSEEMKKYTKIARGLLGLATVTNAAMIALSAYALQAKNFLAPIDAQVFTPLSAVFFVFIVYAWFKEFSASKPSTPAAVSSNPISTSTVLPSPNTEHAVTPERQHAAPAADQVPSSAKP